MANETAVRVFDLGGIHLARLQFNDSVPQLEIADPGGETTPPHWVIISGRDELTRLAHGILEFCMDYPERDEETTLFKQAMNKHEANAGLTKL